MTKVGVEICIEALDPIASKLAATAASVGGADRIELCADMSQDGLTPSVDAINLVREVFGGELLVMIRPRAPGDFPLFTLRRADDGSRDFVRQQRRGADSVVLGALERRQPDQWSG